MSSEIFQKVLSESYFIKHNVSCFESRTRIRNCSNCTTLSNDLTILPDICRNRYTAEQAQVWPAVKLSDVSTTVARILEWSKRFSVGGQGFLFRSALAT